MKEPCRSCPERGRDFGGCRCQAYLLTGDADNADPVCELSPHHHLVTEAVARAEQAAQQPPGRRVSTRSCSATTAPRSRSPPRRVRGASVRGRNGDGGTAGTEDGRAAAAAGGAAGEPL